jgi:hypothetical protein
MSHFNFGPGKKKWFIPMLFQFFVKIVLNEFFIIKNVDLANLGTCGMCRPCTTVTCGINFDNISKIKSKFRISFLFYSIKILKLESSSDTHSSS